ncbi:MAG: hypothetical protein ACYC5N_04305, partial [Endomicrobiales bacterium]
KKAEGAGAWQENRRPIAPAREPALGKRKETRIENCLLIQFITVDKAYIKSYNLLNRIPAYSEIYGLLMRTCVRRDSYV